MLNVVTWSLIASSITVLSTFAIVLAVYLHKKFKRVTIWEASTDLQLTINSAPISRRSSTSCLIHLEKQAQTSRSRSASFSEDLTARLQTLAAGNNYRSYSPATIASSPRLIRPSLGANIRLPTPLTISTKPTIPPSVTYQLRYEHTIETLFITIFQLQNHLPVKNTQNIFLILYLLPNDDEQRQTQSSTNGLFNEHFHFPLKSDELSKRTLRFTAYTVDSTTRVRNILGHVLIKLDQFIDQTQTDKTFSTTTLSECLTQDLQIRSDYLGELILTNNYLKDENLIRIHIQQINHLHLDASHSLKAHFSGQTTNTSLKPHWTNTSTFIIPSTSSFRLDQELHLVARGLIVSNNEDHIDCHLRLHVHGLKPIHSHARWQYSLRTNLPETMTVPLVAL